MGRKWERRGKTMGEMWMTFSVRACVRINVEWKTCEMYHSPF